MKAIIVEGTTTMPETKIDENKLFIKGRGMGDSYDNKNYFQPIFNWLRSNVPSIAKQHEILIIDIHLEYFKTSFSGGLNEFLKYLVELNKNSIKIKVIWNYLEEDDDDMCMAGKDYAATINLPFEFRTVA